MNNIYMQRALDIAFQRMGLTSPNPPVGAVIVKDNRVLGEGGTSAYGGNHAEINAIASVNPADLKGSELYVSLEPCSHYGRTAPCTEAIISSGIKKVYLPIRDPNPLVAGKGVKALIDAGVEVEIVWEWADRAADIIRHFKKFILRHTPFVIHKSALTLDGRTASLSGDSKWISSPSSRYIVHKIRSRVDAVIIGRNTFNLDAPQLNVRFNDFILDGHEKKSLFISGRKNFFIDSLIESEITEYRDPLKVLMGLPEPDQMYNNAFFASDNFLIYERKNTFEKKFVLFKDKPAILERVIVIDFDDRIDMIDAVLRDLAARGVACILLEGGSELAGSFYDAGSIDQYLYFMAPIMLGNGRALISSSGSPEIADAFRLNDLSIYRVERDILFCGYREVYNFEMM